MRNRACPATCRCRGPVDCERRRPFPARDRAVPDERTRPRHYLSRVLKATPKVNSTAVIAIAVRPRGDFLSLFWRDLWPRHRGGDRSHHLYRNVRQVDRAHRGGALKDLDFAASHWRRYSGPPRPSSTRRRRRSAASWSGRTRHRKRCGGPSRYFDGRERKRPNRVGQRVERNPFLVN